MATDLQDEERRRHIDGFVDSFVDTKKRDRYRSFLLRPKKRAKITDDFNHKLVRDLITKHIVTKPPRYRSDTIAYVISDEKEIDDTFVAASDALDLVESAYFGTVVSIIAGILVAVKEESPAPVLWLHRRESK